MKRRFPYSDVVAVIDLLHDAVTAHLGVDAVGVAEHPKRAADLAVEADRPAVIDKIGVSSGEAALLFFLLLRLAVLTLLRNISLCALLVALIVVLISPLLFVQTAIVISLLPIFRNDYIRIVTINTNT